MQAFRSIVLAGAILVGIAGCSDDSPDKVLTIAAASDLKPVLDPIANRFQADTGVTVSIVYGSSGQLATQIAQGSPIDLFFSADRSKAESAATAVKADPASLKVYALARLAVWVGQGTAPDLAGLTDSRFTHIAIANPEHAPYGKAAEEALKTAGVYDTVSSRLVLGENVADTLRLATSGNADAAVVALSLAQAAGGSFVEVPTDQFTPLEQTAVITATKSPARRWAADLLARMTNDVGRSALAEAGFGLPV